MRFIQVNHQGKTKTVLAPDKLKPVIEERARANQQGGQGGILLSQKSDEAIPIRTDEEQETKELKENFPEVPQEQEQDEILLSSPSQKSDGGEPSQNSDELITPIRTDEAVY